MIGPESFPIAADAEAVQSGASQNWIDLVPGILNLPEFLSEAEKTLIERTLKETSGAQAETARRLGISRSHLAYKISKYRLKPTPEDD